MEQKGCRRGAGVSCAWCGRQKENISELIYCEPESICDGCRLLDAVCGAAGSDLRLQSPGDC